MTTSTQQKGTEQASGREMGDHAASVAGDTSSSTNVNNEGDTPQSSDPAASNSEVSADGASWSTSAGQSGLAGAGSHTSIEGHIFGKVVPGGNNDLGKTENEREGAKGGSHGSS